MAVNSLVMSNDVLHLIGALINVDLLQARKVTIYLNANEPVRVDLGDIMPRRKSLTTKAAIEIGCAIGDSQHGR